MSHWTNDKAALSPIVAPGNLGVEPVKANGKRLSISQGQPLQLDDSQPITLPMVLRRAAAQTPCQDIFYLQPDGTEIYQTYSNLLAEAERILTGLKKSGINPQDKVIFQLQRSQDFIAAFWACQLGGFVPVPVSIPPSFESANSFIKKLHNAWKMLGQPLVLTSATLAPAVHSLSKLLDLEGLRVGQIDDLRTFERASNWYSSQPDDLALLLLTSGSTGLPKAVMQTHRSLLARTVGTIQLNGDSRQDVSLNWMPLEHVGGIVMFHVRDVYLGCRQVQVPTQAILSKPLLWLDLIERYRVTVTWAPNFAFKLVNDHAAEIAERHWDLSSLRFILNGGEAIVPRTACQFMELLQPHGLQTGTMFPAWGMSETCSGVVYSHRFSAKTTMEDDRFVEVGRPIPGFAIRIVDAEDRPVEEQAIGRLQVKGPSVTAGYYQNPELNQEVFTSDGWFKTGDLGFLCDGRLTITGREKDVIIIRGLNYYAHEIEAIVEEVAGVESTFTAACAVRSPQSDTDKLCIFFSPSIMGEISRLDLIKEIRGKLVREVGLNPDYMVPVEQQVIPKTEIGKIQHAELQRRFEAGQFNAILKQLDILAKAEFYPLQKPGEHSTSAATPDCMATALSLPVLDRFGTVGDCEFKQISEMPLTSNGKPDHTALLEQDAEQTNLKAAYGAPGTEMEKRLMDIWHEVLNVEMVRVHDNFFELGGDSLLAIQVIARIHQMLGTELPLHVFFEVPTVASLAKYIDIFQLAMKDLQTNFHFAGAGPEEEAGEI